MTDISDFLSNDALTQDNQKILDYSSIVLGVRSMNNLSSIVVDFDNRRVIYQSENLIYLDEVNSGDSKRLNNIPYWSLIDEKKALELSQVRKVHELGAGQYSFNID